MKNNKSIRVTKKQIFIKKLISTLLICLMLAAAACFSLFIYFRGEIFSIHPSISSIIEEGYLNGKGNAFAQNLVSMASFNEDLIDSYVAIYDENGEIFIEPKDAAYLVVKDKDVPANSKFYSLASSAEHCLDEILEEHRPSDNNDDVYEYTHPLTLNRFCLIDDTFIPLEINNGDSTTITLDMQIPDRAVVLTSDDVESAFLRFCYKNKNLNDFSFVQRAIKENKGYITVTEWDRIINISKMMINDTFYYVGDATIINIKFFIHTALKTMLPIALVIAIIIAVLRTSKEFAMLNAHYVIEDQRKELIDRLAHDLKSPLMVISGYAENLNANINPDNHKHYIESILENVKYMDGIIADVLNLSKIEDININIKKESFDAADIINELGANYQDCFNKNEQTFSCEGAAVFETDKALMKSILDNIISNAVKYTDKQGEIIVKCEKGKITMSNTCSNAEKLDLSTITEPFVKGDNSRSGRKGSGLGLALARKTAERLHLKLNLKFENGMFIAEIADKQ